MSVLEWGKPGSRLFETGIDRGVLYPSSGPGIPWIGLLGVEEDYGDSGSEPVYFDGLKIRDVESIGDFSATLAAFIYPDEFDEMRGYSSVVAGITADDQLPKQFNLSYRTRIGNDLEGEDFGYRIHLIYNALVVPATRSRQTIGEEMNLTSFEWQISAVPITIQNARPTAHLIFDSSRINTVMLRKLEDILYGTSGTNSRVPTIAELMSLSDSAIPYRLEETAPNIWEIYETDRANIFMSALSPTPTAEPILWLDSSGGSYSVPKLVTGG